MSIGEWLFGRKPATRASQPQSQSQMATSNSIMPANAGAVQLATRREMLRVVLRDTLNRHGIPAAWITAEMLVSTSRTRESGIHWRLSIKHWDPRLPVHTVAFQNNLIKRVMAFDPLATNWLMGISWQFSVDDESACPPMPHPGLWTSEPPRPKAAEVNAPAGGSAGVIAGPVRIGGGESDAAGSSAKEDLERLFAVRDADMQRHAEDTPRPVFQATEPSKLDPRI